MTKHLMAACLGLLMACGSSKPSSTTPNTGSATTPEQTEAACAPEDCGPEPPISPSACPEGASISSVCQRAASGSCERHVLCDGQDASTATPPAAQP